MEIKLSVARRLAEFRKEFATDLMVHGWNKIPGRKMNPMPDGRHHASRFAPNALLTPHQGVKS